jgi:hypothetical protein
VHEICNHLGHRSWSEKNYRLGLQHQPWSWRGYEKAPSLVNQKFGNVTRELAKLREKLSILHANNNPREEIRATRDLMNETLYREEMLWLQRFRIYLLREGDCNTKFFHYMAVWRARKNKIQKLEDDMGVIQTTPTEMQRMVVSYF